jgi:hypothetical protein
MNTLILTLFVISIIMVPTIIIYSQQGGYAEGQIGLFIKQTLGNLG